MDGASSQSVFQVPGRVLVHRHKSGDSFRNVELVCGTAVTPFMKWTRIQEDVTCPFCIAHHKAEVARMVDLNAALDREEAAANAKQPIEPTPTDADIVEGLVWLKGFVTGLIAHYAADINTEPVHRVIDAAYERLKGGGHGSHQ